MNCYRITYKRTGRVNDKDYVCICDGDEITNGKRVHNIADAIDAFEKLAAENWHTFENKNAIVNIQVSEW